MAKAISPTTGQPYVVKRVCDIWDVARSSFYAARAERQNAVPTPARRGPKPAINDAALIAGPPRTKF
jgi:putative transposase